MAEFTPRGIKYPTSEDKIKDGTSPSALADDFKDVAVTTDAKLGEAVQEAINDATTKYGGLPSRVSAVEEKNTQQDARLEGLDSLQATKSVRVENGKWVWDRASATHYVLIDHDGKPVVRATPWPVPNPTTPEFTW